MEKKLQKVIEKLEKLLQNKNIPEDLRTGKILDIYPKQIKHGKVAHPKKKEMIVKRLKDDFYRGKPDSVIRDDLEKIDFDLSWVILSSVNMSTLDFRNVKFLAANLSGADLSGAKLSQADFSFAEISGGNFSQADLSLANLTLVGGQGTDFSGANLSMANAKAAHFAGSNFDTANLSMAELSDCNLSNASFEGAVLEGINIENSIITGTVFELIIESKKAEEKKYGTDFFSGAYKTETHTYMGRENTYAVKSFYKKKGHYS